MFDSTDKEERNLAVFFLITLVWFFIVMAVALVVLYYYHNSRLSNILMLVAFAPALLAVFLTLTS